MLHQRTKATLAELVAADWFSAIGKPVDGPIIVVASWYEAMTYCESDAWERILLGTANALAERVMKGSSDRYRLWNEIATEIRQVTIPLVEQRTQEIIEEFRLPTTFKATVEWDVAHLCMEAEYADVTPPGFYAAQAYWYVQGHFPCGWEGAQYPEGKLVVY